MILDNLAKVGVPNDRTAEGMRADSADGMPQRVAVSIGPQDGTVSPNWIKDTAHEARGLRLAACRRVAFRRAGLGKSDEAAPVRRCAPPARGRSLERSAAGSW